MIYAVGVEVSYYKDKIQSGIKSVRKITVDELTRLINENTAEATHVDFKQVWHDNKAKLIHDILCLANSDYNGDRFLLFGVDNNAKIVGVQDSDKNRKDNAKLFDLLRQSNFNRLPDIDIYTLQANNSDVDVIQIGNTAHKPYFLTKDKKHNGKTTVRAGAVYCRNGTSNTPINSTASEIEIEKMWRERFGLDQTPAKRIKEYLLDVDNWVYDQSSAFYGPFPKFTVQEDFDAPNNLPSDQEWSRGEIGYHYTPGNSASQILIYYHQTCLGKIHLVIFDGTKKCIVAPRWEPVGAGRFYYYLKDSVDYAYQIHMTKLWQRKDDSKGLRFSCDSTQTGAYDIPVFQNKSELQEFLESLLAQGLVAPSTEPSMQNKLWYNALKEYNNWRAVNKSTKKIEVRMSKPI